MCMWGVGWGVSEDEGVELFQGGIKYSQKYDL